MLRLAFFDNAVAYVYPDRIKVYFTDPFPGNGWIITQTGDRLVCRPDGY